MTSSLPITILIEVRSIVLYILGGSNFRDSVDEILRCDHFNERFSSSYLQVDPISRILHH